MWMRLRPQTLKAGFGTAAMDYNKLKYYIIDYPLPTWGFASGSLYNYLSYLGLKGYERGLISNSLIASSNNSG